VKGDAEIIAERELVCRKPTGQESRVFLKLGKPYQSAAREWACPVAADGMVSRLADIRGIDSFQALTLGHWLLRNLVQSEMANGSTFHWPDSGEALSLEEVFGKAV
jgi:hypothetical protein